MGIVLHSGPIPGEPEIFVLLIGILLHAACTRFMLTCILHCSHSTNAADSTETDAAVSAESELNLLLGLGCCRHAPVDRAA